jgi:peptide/nickel transport system permease protein
MRRWLTRLGGRLPILLGGAIVLLLVAMAAGAGVVFPDDPMAMVAPPLLWPGADPAFPLGTDSLGRDIAAGIVHGARASLAIGFLSSGAALLLGTAVGATAGHFGGRVDDGLMRLCELFQAIPQFMLVIVLLVIFRPTLLSIIGALAVVSWPPIARLVRAEFIVLREREFVQSCRVIGMSEGRIMLTQILPNALPVIVVGATIMVATAILMEAALSFLGLGDPNVLTWGAMIGMGRDQLREAWFVVVVPGTALLVTALGLNLLGEGLNDVLNPRRMAPR